MKDIESTLADIQTAQVPASLDQKITAIFAEAGKGSEPWLVRPVPAWACLTACAVCVCLTAISLIHAQTASDPREPDAVVQVVSIAPTANLLRLINRSDRPSPYPFH